MTVILDTGMHVSCLDPYFVIETLEDIEHHLSCLLALNRSEVRVEDTQLEVEVAGEEADALHCKLEMQ